jgi:CRP-like cAMP-binding protein
MQLYHHQSHFHEVVQLTMGKSFGELALINNKPRAATIKCLTDCHFAVISKNVYERILKKIEVKNQNKLVDFF